ncbi:MAG TPA: hypothetical protein VEX86_23685 [Longimicrobium sp.]|nr:hypothetical protein [Longimicrobium sp.]
MAVHAPALFYELPVRRFPSAAERLLAPPREGRTLEDMLSGAWEDLTAHRTATCPICDGAMTPRYGSGPSAVGGRCVSCRTELN